MISLKQTKLLSFRKFIMTRDGMLISMAKKYHISRQLSVASHATEAGDYQIEFKFEPVSCKLEISSL